VPLGVDPARDKVDQRAAFPYRKYCRDTAGLTRKGRAIAFAIDHDGVKAPYSHEAMIDPKPGAAAFKFRIITPSESQKKLPEDACDRFGMASQPVVGLAYGLLFRFSARKTPVVFSNRSAFAKIPNDICPPGLHGIAPAPSNSADTTAAGISPRACCAMFIA